MCERPPPRHRQALAPLTALALALASGAGACATNAPSPAGGHQSSALRPAEALVVQATVAHRGERGLPTFAWLSTQLPPGQAGQTTESLGPERVAAASLRALMGPHASAAALTSAKLRTIHDIGRGALVVEYDQVVDGQEVFLGGVRVALARDLTPLAASGTLYPELRTLGPARLSAEDAIARATRRMTGAALSPALVRRGGEGDGGYALFTLPPLDGHGDGGKAVVVAAAPARAKSVWFPGPRGLTPAYAIELDLGLASSTDSELRGFVVSALDGGVLFETSMTATDAYSYRVFADGPPGFLPWDGPQGTTFTPYPAAAPNGTDPPYVTPALVTLASAPFSKNDPWLPPSAPELLGNNARAYVDRAAPDGFGDGDLLVPPTSPGRFDRVYDARDPPQAADRSSRAVATQLFYVVNFLHDAFYDAGWNEASRNAQTSNFGRGGAQNDRIRAEVQDQSGRNNANATTPADGRSPRIQMYLYDSFNGPRGVTLTAPAELAATFGVVPSRSGPRAFSVSGVAALVDDGVGATGDGCESPFVNAEAIAGHVAVLDAGNCGYPLKAYNAEANGAVGVLITATAGTPLPTALPSTPSAPGAITIPGQGLVAADGATLKAAIAAGAPVELTLSAAPIDRDGALDLSVSAHEWTHILTSRLIGNGSGLGEVQARGLGEGWSDFVANLTLTRPEDAASPPNRDWRGSWAHAGFASSSPGNNAHYFGNRRYPISSDYAHNPLTFTHIQNGVALPTSPAPRSGQSGANNAEVHATGEVWAEMLWECYVALLRDTARYSFADANSRMREYLVTALKLTPSKPTFLEARDALLVAAYAGDPRDHTLFHQAFARRGAGVGAQGPSKTATDNTPVTESFSAGHALAFVGASLDDALDPCDGDGVLDNGELGALAITVRNVGPDTLTAVKVSATTTLAGASFPQGSSATFAPIAPYATGTATLPVALTGAQTAASGRFELTVTEPALAPPGQLTAALESVVQFDDRPGAGRTDTMDAPTTAWSTSDDAALSLLHPFGRVFVGQDAHWHVDGNPAAADQRLVSPPLTLDASSSLGSLEVTFRQRYRFETSPFGAFHDGGVVEFSLDNGAQWVDLGERASEGGYAGTLDAKSTSLGSRRAFVGESPGYPSYLTSRLTLPAECAGKTILVRFRAATNGATNSDGWDIDDFALQGLASTPFGARVDNRGVCKNHAPVAHAGEPQSARSGDLLRLAGSATDRDGDALRFAWTQTAGPPVTLSDPTAATATLKAPSVDVTARVELSLVARDATLASAPSTVALTIEPALVAPSAPASPPPGTGEGCSTSPRPSAGGAARGLLLGLAAAWLARRRRTKATDTPRRPS